MAEGPLPALFITVRYAFEKEQMFAIDCPCAMLLARIIKTCMEEVKKCNFEDMPQIQKYDLKEQEGAAAGLGDLELERAHEHLKSRGIYELIGLYGAQRSHAANVLTACAAEEEGGEPNAEYPLCQEEPQPEPDPDAEGGEGEDGSAKPTPR